MDYLNWSSIPSSKLLVLASYTSNFSPCNHRQSPTIWRHQRFSVNGKNVHKACCDAKEKLMNLTWCKWNMWSPWGHAFIIAVIRGDNGPWLLWWATSIRGGAVAKQLQNRNTRRRVVSMFQFKYVIVLVFVYSVFVWCTWLYSHELMVMSVMLKIN